MSLTDLLIIYASLGAPVAVYVYLQTRNRGAFAYIPRTLASLIFWPAAFLYTIFAAETDLESHFPNDDADEKKTDHIVKAIIQSIRSENSVGRTLNECRELLDRYIGLHLSQAAPEYRFNGWSELLERAGHPNGEISAACLGRRFASIHAAHRAAAAREFSRLFIDLPIGSARRELAAELARIVGDVAGERALSAASMNLPDSLEPAARAA